MNRLKTVIFALLMLRTLTVGAQRIDRGYDISHPATFVGKGWWMVGGTARYSIHSMEDFSIPIVDDINSMGYNLVVSPAFCYMLKDNLGVGARVEYDRSMAKIDTASVNIAGLGLALDQYHTISHNFKTKAILRNYIPIGDSKVFALFNESQLSFGWGQSKVACRQDSGVDGTYAETSSIGLHICPGLIAFASDHLAVEVNVNMLGLDLSHTKQLHNQVLAGYINSTSVNFRINILSVGFGLYYYL